MHVRMHVVPCGDFRPRDSDCAIFDGIAFQVCEKHHTWVTHVPQDHLRVYACTYDRNRRPHSSTGLSAGTDKLSERRSNG